MKPAHRTAALLGVLALSTALVIADRRAADGGAVIEAAPRHVVAPARMASPVPDDGAILAIAPRAGYGNSPESFFAPVRPPAPPPPPPQPEAPPQPTTPSAPYQVIGKQQSEGRWEVFLAQGDASLVAHAGERLDANWQVVSIRPPVMELEYVPNKQRQTLSIGADFND